VQPTRAVVENYLSAGLKESKTKIRVFIVGYDVLGGKAARSLENVCSNFPKSCRNQ
jgi:hypothetical protein